MLVLVMQEPPFRQKQSVLERKEENALTVQQINNIKSNH